jgi:hypothetical protein
MLTLALPGGDYTPAANSGGTDDYHCFLIDPSVSADSFITGVQFLPGNPSIVHHAILFRVEPQQVAAAEQKDAASPGRGWTCFGGPGLPSYDRDPVRALDSAPWLAGWAPGSDEQVFGAGFGVPLSAGSRIVLQVHYHLVDGGGDDASRVRLRMASGAKALTPLETMLLPAPVELPCNPDEHGVLCDRQASVLDVMRRFGPDAGRTVAGLQLLCDGNLENPRAGATQSCDRPVRERMTIRAAAGHMHLLGRSIRIEVNPDRPDHRTVLDIPMWDFDNQGAKPLPSAVTVSPGDTLRVTCTHDVGLRKLLPSLQQAPPRYVTWGEGTTDEMCLGILVVTRAS